MRALSTNLRLAVVDRNNFTAEFYNLKVENLIVCVVRVFEPKYGERAYFGVIEKHITYFLYLSIEVISISQAALSHNYRPNRAKNDMFVGEFTSALNKYINVT